MTGSVLIVSHFYPPSTMVAARRPSGFAKYLERRGYRVTVLTSSAWGVAESEPASAVIRTADLMSSPLNWRRDNFEAWIGDAAQDDYSEDSSLLARVVVPDLAVVTWAPFALTAAVAATRHQRFDCVITTSGPESVHFTGLALRRLGIAWIADFRDGWGFESVHHRWPTRAQERIDAYLERVVVTRADAVSAVSEPMAADIRRRFGVDARSVTNGYDPDEVPLRTGADELLRGDRHSLVHTGRMASSQRSPGPVVEAIRILRHRAPADAERLELVLAGPLTAEERELISAPDLADHIRHVGNLPRERALRLQREADSLLLLTAGSRTGEATGKLFEYLSARRPILVLGERTEAARIVLATGAGSAAPADSPEEIAERLSSLLHDGRGEAEPATEAYSYSETTRLMAELIETARARAAQRKKMA